MNEPALVLAGVTKEFPIGRGRLPVLKGVDLEVRQGEAVAIMGPSGAGKTTLLNIAGGLMHPTAGSIRIQGQELFAQDDEKLSRLRNQLVGFVFQLHHLLPEFTAEENVALPALISGLARGEAIRRSRDLLDQVGLAQRTGHRPGELSGGEQQRVAIARALMNRPALLLADEPTGDLDLATALEIHVLLMSLNRERGQTLIVVTHNPELAGLVDRVIMLKDGLVDQTGGG